MAKLEICLCHGELNGFVWSVDDANDLRVKHRVLGNFNNHISKRNDQNKKKKLNDKNMIIGLPFILNQLEIRLCFELNIASIVHQCIDDNTFKFSNDSNTNNKNHKHKNDIIYQFFIENNLKRMESLKEKCQYQQNKEQIESSSIGQKRTLNETDIVPFTNTNNAECKSKLLSTSNVINSISLNNNGKIHISPSHNDFILFPKQLFDVYSFGDISVANNYDTETFWSKLFNFAASSNRYQYGMFEEQYVIYKDLYDNGFYILMDRRFSGNFVVYQESPYASISLHAQIHSKYIVQIISKYARHYKFMLNLLDEYCAETMKCDNNINGTDKDTKLLELDIRIMCFVRIAVNVKKDMLFAYIGRRRQINKVRYYIVKWHYYKNEATQITESKTSRNEMDDNVDKEMWYQVYSDYKP